MKERLILIAAVCAVLTCFSPLQATVIIETVPVGNAGNIADNEVMSDSTTGYGAVSYEYNIGKYEVTAGQYRDFLNAVADTDTYELYDTSMDSSIQGCQITRNGSSGSYTYDFSGRPSGTETDWVNRPVNFVSWGDAARFANWLHNGQPTGVQGLATTEDGSYYLNGAVSDEALQAVTREADATWVIPTEDEWYKAAYYKGGGTNAGYWDYATSSNSTPSNDLVNPDGGNNANFYISGGDYTIGSPYYRTEVGEFENSDSPYGTFDQGGNVWEYNEAVIGSYRGHRGGSFESPDFLLEAFYRDFFYPTSDDPIHGFRVVSIPLPGDVDGDGWVSGSDLSVIISYWGLPLGREYGDLNGNGTVDGPDYSEVISYWGTGTPPEPPSSVPEPATLGLLLLSGVVLLRRRRM